MNSTQVSATAGQAITMWGTGLGAGKGPDNLAPIRGTLPTPVEVWIGNQQAQVAYSGRSPCCAGVDQIVFNVPANAPHGCWVPVYVRTGGATTSNVATMAVNTKSGACSDPTNPVLQTFLNGGPMGILTLFRSATHQTVDVTTPVDITTDFVTLNAWNQKGGPFVFAPAISTPPAGTCTVYTSPGDFFTSGSLSVPDTASSVLATGTSITLTGPGGAKNVTLESNSGAINLGSYGTLLSLPNQLVLNPGNYTVADTAGANVGAFSSQVTIPAAFTWTNRDAGDSVDRSQPLQVTWSGVNAATSMSILGASVDLPTNSTAMFQCIAAPGETSFTVPAAILSALPPTRPTPLQNKSMLFLSNGAISNGVKFTASGLTSSVAIPVLLTGKTVVFASGIIPVAK